MASAHAHAARGLPRPGCPTSEREAAKLLAPSLCPLAPISRTGSASLSAQRAKPFRGNPLPFRACNAQARAQGDAQANADVPTSALPTVDLAPFKGVPLEAVASLVEESRDAAECVRAVHDACTRVGFFYLVNHGVDAHLVDRVRDVTRTFFHLPDAQKQEIALEKSPHFRGYQKVGQNITKGNPDWHEALDLYREFSEDHPTVQGRKPLHGPNQWPDTPADFKPTMEEYVARLKELGRLVMRLIALALGVPVDTFEGDRVSDPFWVLRAIGYPPLPSSTAERGSLSCGEHTDYGLLTFVNQDPGITALEVMQRNGTWVDAPPVPGAFVVNIGDMLTVWSNGKYQSTLHRVLNRSDKYRVSVPFFYEPNFDAVVEPLQECVERSPTGQPLYQPVTYGEHLQRKVTTNFV